MEWKKDKASKKLNTMTITIHIKDNSITINSMARAPTIAMQPAIIMKESSKMHNPNVNCL